ncbi:MAG: hypothetical protein BWY07_02722 [Candidatus Hydrogenedentes bacterium ADurb.Bin170]|nr:MAG: hypothetical protein BWY07_02722 [Candidatus Hydrogenedentes bacterium ADurb.Bin170]
MMICGIERKADTLIDAVTLRTVLVGSADHRTLQGECFWHYDSLLIISGICTKRTAFAVTVDVTADSRCSTRFKSNNSDTAVIAVRICLARVEASGDLRPVAVTSCVFCSVRCETYIECLRCRSNHADAALIRCDGIAAALVERSACSRFIESTVRIVRHHRIGVLAAYTESLDLRLKKRLVIIGCKSCGFIGLPDSTLPTISTTTADF